LTPRAVARRAIRRKVVCRVALIAAGLEISASQLIVRSVFVKANADIPINLNSGSQPVSYVGIFRIIR